MRIIDAVEKWALVVLMILLIALVSFQVFNRVVVKISMPWLEETARYTAAWVVFIGASYAAKQKAHIGVTAVVDMLPKGWRKSTEVFMYVTCVMFSLVMLFYGIKIVIVQMNMGQLTPALRIPMYWPYLSIPLGGLMLTLRFCEQIVLIVGQKDISPT
jgi:C4-dicarboxylate transporter DctQ subunit